MMVKCELNTYDSKKLSLNFNNKLIVKDINNRELVKLVIDNNEFVVDGDELISAIKKCQLNCFGR